MKKQVFSLITLLIVMTVVYTACRKGDVQLNNDRTLSSEKVSSTTISDNFNVLQKNSIMDKIAKQLAVNLKQKDMRAFVKSEALKQFDGDYDILYRNIKDIVISGKALKSHLVNNTKDSELSSNDVEELASTMPLLNISVPMNIEKWDTDNYTPMVAVVPADYDDKTAKLVKAYDGDGNIHYLDATKSPDVPVVVVGLNERTRIKDKKLVVLSYPPIVRQKQFVKMENRRNVAIS
ncbi:MAG: DUF3103 family protein, partial [Candidatus Dojkabacteria bacterium]